MSLGKIINAIILICFPVYVIMVSYYILLFNDFSKSGFILTILLTIIPALAGVYFGVILKIKKKKNKNESNKIQ